MPSDTYLLIGVGCVALLVAWLVFSLIKKLFGLILLAGLVIAGVVLWNSPDLQRSVTSFLSDFIGNR